MREALEGSRESSPEPPDGIVTVRIDPETGDLASASNSKAEFESFRKENVPSRLAESVSDTGSTGQTVAEKLF